MKTEKTRNIMQIETELFYMGVSNPLKLAHFKLHIYYIRICLKLTVFNRH